LFKYSHFGLGRYSFIYCLRITRRLTRTLRDMFMVIHKHKRKSAVSTAS